MQVQIGQDQVSGGVSVPLLVSRTHCNVLWKLQNLVISSKSVIKSSSVISSQIGIMSDQLKVSLLYGHVPECHVTFGRGGLHNV